MKLLHERCAGLDVHSRSIVASVRVVAGDRVKRDVETFGSTTSELMRLASFLGDHGCTIAAMEATGVYWQPVWAILESQLKLVLVNAREFHNVPGRKTDVSDAQWLADLLAHGLLRSSLVPPRPQQEVRELTRTRKQLVRERSRHVQRLQKVLEPANIKLTNVVADILGATGRAILEAIAAGETDPEALAALRKGRLKASHEQLCEALRGSPTAHHRFEIRLHLGLIDGLDRAIAEVDARLEQAIEPFRDAVERLQTIPGVGPTVAVVLVGEMGADMSRFPTAGHLRSWAGLCPRADESAGKKRSTRLQPRAAWLRPALLQGALAAIKVKDSYLRAHYLRIRSRRGHKKAAIAVAAAMTTAAYHMLKNNVDYRELGGAYLDAVDKGRAASRHVRRLRELGFVVTVAEQGQPPAEA
jgi:transposase